MILSTVAKKTKSPDEDSNLLKKVIAGDNDALIELVKKHENLYYRVVLPFMISVSNNGISLNREKYLIFYNAAKAFDPKRGMKFSVFMAQRAKFYCKSIVSKRIIEDELKECHDIPEPDSDESLHQISEIKKRIDSLSNSKIKDIMTYRYFNGNHRVKTFAEISEKVGMSPRNVKYIHDRFIKQLQHLRDT